MVAIDGRKRGKKRKMDGMKRNEPTNYYETSEKKTVYTILTEYEEFSQPNQPLYHLSCSVSIIRCNIFHYPVLWNVIFFICSILSLSLSLHFERLICI